MLRRLAFFAIGFSLCISSVQAAENSVKVGLLESMFQDVPKPILTAMSEPFRNLMTKQTGLSGDVEICKDYKQLLGKLQDRSLHVGVFHGFEYAWAKTQEPNLQPLVVTIPHGKKAMSVLLVSQDSGINKISDLKNQKIVMCKGTKAFTRLHMEKINAQNPGLKFATEQITAEEALNAVALGKEKAVITDASTLTGYALLQPGAHSKLKILVESEQFPCSVIAMIKGALTEEEAGKITNGMATASKNAQGRAMLTMWSLKGFEKVPADYEEQCKKIIAAYPAPTGTTSTVANPIPMK